MSQNLWTVLTYLQIQDTNTHTHIYTEAHKKRERAKNDDSFVDECARRRFPKSGTTERLLVSRTSSTFLQRNERKRRRNRSCKRVFLISQKVFVSCESSFAFHAQPKTRRQSHLQDLLQPPPTQSLFCSISAALAAFPFLARFFTATPFQDLKNYLPEVMQMICKKKIKQILTGSPVIVSLKNLYAANSGNATMIQFGVSASLFEVYNVLDVTNTRFKERKLQLGTPASKIPQAKI